MTSLTRATPEPLATTQASTPHVDQSIASATGASEEIVPANADRRELVIYNYSNKDWWINPTGGTAAANTAGNIRVDKKGGILTLHNTNAVTGIADATTPLSVWEG